MQKNIFIVLGIFALCIFESATAIKCYQCKSLSDPNCAKEKIEKGTSMRMVDCSTLPVPNNMEQYKPVTKCNKVVTKDPAGQITSRDCHFELLNAGPNECHVSHSQDIVSCKTCDTDLCDTSSAGRFLALGFAAIIAMVSMHFVL